MTHDNSPSHIHAQAEAALIKAQNAYDKAAHSYYRLTKDAGTEAEREAKRAEEVASEALDKAQEHLRFVVTTVPKPKSKQQKPPEDDRWEE